MYPEDVEEVLPSHSRPDTVLRKFLLGVLGCGLITVILFVVVLGAAALSDTFAPFYVIHSIAYVAWWQFASWLVDQADKDMGHSPGLGTRLEAAAREARRC